MVAVLGLVANLYRNDDSPSDTASAQSNALVATPRLGTGTDVCTVIRPCEVM